MPSRKKTVTRVSSTGLVSVQEMAWKRFYEEMHFFSCQQNIDSEHHHHLFTRIQVHRTHRNTVGETQQIQKSAYFLAITRKITIVYAA